MRGLSDWFGFKSYKALISGLKVHRKVKAVHEGRETDESAKRMTKISEEIIVSVTHTHARSVNLSYTINMTCEK